VVRPGCCDVDPLRSLTVVFFFSSRRRHTRSKRDWSSDVCSSDLTRSLAAGLAGARSAGIADLTTAVMEARKSSVDAAIADLSGIQSGSVPEATVHLVGMSRTDLSALVDLVGAISEAELPEKVPAKSTEAALALVEPIRDAQIDQDALVQLQELLSK